MPQGIQIDVESATGRPGAQCRDCLRQVLAVVEHLSEAVAALVQAWLRRAPGLRVLATSQESLRIAGEQVYRICVLPVADGDVECANRSGALQLFAARAGAVVRGFTPAAENLAVVGSICRRLDGLPLAIELAAARLPLLGLDGIRERLDERFRVLPNSAARRRRYTFTQPSRRRCSSRVGSMKLSLSCVQGAMRWCGQ